MGSCPMRPNSVLDVLNNTVNATQHYTGHLQSYIEFQNTLDVTIFMVLMLISYHVIHVVTRKFLKVR